MHKKTVCKLWFDISQWWVWRFCPSPSCDVRYKDMVFENFGSKQKNDTYFKPLKEFFIVESLDICDTCCASHVICSYWMIGMTFNPVFDLHWIIILQWAHKWNIKQLKLVSGVRRQTDNNYSMMSPQFTGIQFLRTGLSRNQDHWIVHAWF